MKRRDERTRAALVSLAACAACVGGASQAEAAGFALSEQGAGAAGVGGAATARSDLLEAGFYNPAAYAFEGEWRAWAGVAALAPSLTHTSPDGERTTSEASLATPPALHAGGAFGDFGVSASWGVPFGSSVAWPRGWAGRTESIATSLQVFEGGLDVSWRPVDWLAISAGPRVQRGLLGLERGIDVLDEGRDAHVLLAGDSWAWGWRASALARPIESLRLGLSVRSGGTHRFEGDADFRDIPRELEASAHDSAFSAEFPMPWRVAAGAAWQVGDGVVSADVEVFGWDVFQELVIDFEDEDLDDVVQPRAWSNTVAVRAGYEHALGEWRLRAGGSWDPSPASALALSPSSPDSDRLGVSVGGGWRPGFGLTVDVALGFTSLLGASGEGERSYPGTYGGAIPSGSLGVGMRL